MGNVHFSAECYTLAIEQSKYLMVPLSAKNPNILIDLNQSRERDSVQMCFRFLKIHPPWNCEMHEENIWRISMRNLVGLGKALPTRKVTNQATHLLHTAISGVSSECQGQLLEMLNGGENHPKEHVTRYYQTIKILEMTEVDLML